jgi:hypothetical protein
MKPHIMFTLTVVTLAADLAGCRARGGEQAVHPDSARLVVVGADGPAHPVVPKPMRMGDFERGRAIFRFETFGTESFWTDAVRLPQGMAEREFTVVSGLRDGMHFDADAMPPELRRGIEQEVKSDLSPAHARLVNDPNVFARLVRENAVIGIVERGGKRGITCALCHTITDNSVFAMGEKGSIGRRIDGPTPHSLEVGHLLANAANSRALYPILQIDLGGASIGRTPAYRLDKDSTEQEVDAYLNDPKAWPPGTFDETPDGVGNPIRILPLFRQDLAAPYGSSGQNDRADDFGNAVFTLIFDQTNVLSPGGRRFLHALGGAAGDKIIADYTHVLEATNVRGAPYVVTATAGPGVTPPFPTGRRVDDQRLLDLNAYLAGLRAPAGHAERADEVARGRAAFRIKCTGCHGVDPSQPVDARLIPMPVIWPGYNPKVIAMRDSPLSPIQDSAGTFDDKMIVVDASPVRGERGNALPLLLDLARKPAFLHDDSVPSLEELMDPARGKTSPHPFYIESPDVRSDVAAFLRSLGG